MRERYVLQFKYVPSELTKAALNITNTHEHETRSEYAWQPPISPDSAAPVSDATLVFDAIARLSDIRRTDTLWRFRKKATGESTPNAITKEQLSTNYDLLDTTVCGVALTTLFNKKQALAQENPAGAYGHMLLRSVPPSNKELYAAMPYNFLPVTTYSSDEIQTLTRQAHFPAHISTMLHEMSSTYQQSLRQVNKAFFTPDSPHFLAATKMYEEVTSKGTPFQVSLLFSQLLGIGTADQGRSAYAKLKAYTKQGDYPLYEECIANIEDSFDGLLGEEVYEPLGIERHANAQPDTEAYAALHRKKQQLLKMTSNAQATIPLETSSYGMLYLIEPEIRYHKNGTATNIALYADVQTKDEQTVPISFQLSAKDSYSWDFLRSNSELPELFNALLETTDQALERAIIQFGQASARPTFQPIAPKPEYTRDPVYTLRKEERQQDKNQAAGTTKCTNTIDSSDKFAMQPLEIDFPEAIANSLDDTTRAMTEEAIDKYSRGLRNIAPIISLSTDGKKVFRLRKGPIRVLVEKEADRLIVFDAGPRKSIYS